MRIALKVFAIVCLVAAAALLLALTLQSPPRRTITWPLTGVIIVTAPALLLVGLRRRRERGRPAGFKTGVGLVDVIEGIAGQPLSTAMQVTITTAAVALTLMPVAALLWRRLG